MIKLVSPLKEIKKAIEKGELAEFRSRTHMILPLLKEAEKAADAKDLVHLKNAAYGLGIIGINTEPAELVAYIQKALNLINTGLDFFINDPDEKVTVANLPTFVSHGELEYLPGPMANIKLTVNLHVDFKGFEILSNYQEFTPFVKLEIENARAINAIVDIKLRSIGLFQDQVNSEMEQRDLDGTMTGSPVMHNYERTKQGLDILRQKIFGYTNLQRVSFDVPRGASQIEYGLNGATIGIGLEVGVFGQLSGKSGFPFQLTNSVWKWGYSV